MAEKNPTARSADSEPSATERQELQDEVLILKCLMVHWPVHLQPSDLLREMGLDPEVFADRDRVDRAIDQLYWAGLAILCGPAVVPTRAAFQAQLLGDQTPSHDQLLVVCKLLWSNLGRNGLVSAYTRTPLQLARQLTNFSVKGSAKALIEETVLKEKVVDVHDLDKLIKDICQFVRSIAGYSFPVRLRALERIQAEVFGRLGLDSGEYSAYAGRVEGLFLESPLVALDEYGVPPELAQKLGSYLHPDGDLDGVLSRIKELSASDLGVTAFEEELIKYAQAGL